MKHFLIIFTLMLYFTIIYGQSRYEYRYEPFVEKPGSCPPPLPVDICSQSCFSDSHCLGIGKCCPTNCGGFVCTKPVTMRKTSKEKPGSCPAIPKGRWICSSTCSVDSDCRSTMKCCKNRCGAMACQKPDIQESMDIPVIPLPEDSYDISRNVNPRVNPNNYPSIDILY